METNQVPPEGIEQNKVYQLKDDGSPDSQIKPYINNSEVYYMHFGHAEEHTYKVSRRGTIAAFIENSMLVYGISLCSYDDNFDKKRGIEKANENLELKAFSIPINDRMYDNQVKDKEGNIRGFGHREVALTLMKGIAVSCENNSSRWKRLVTDSKYSAGMTNFHQTDDYKKYGVSALMSKGKSNMQVVKQNDDDETETLAKVVSMNMVEALA